MIWFVRFVLRSGLRDEARWVGLGWGDRLFVRRAREEVGGRKAGREKARCSLRLTPRDAARDMGLGRLPSLYRAVLCTYCQEGHDRDRLSPQSIVHPLLEIEGEEPPFIISKQWWTTYSSTSPALSSTTR